MKPLILIVGLSLMRGSICDVRAQTDSLVDVFPLTPGTRWVFGYSYEWGDDPIGSPMWRWNDTGNVVVTVVSRTVTADSTRWLARETGNHWTRYNDMPWIGPTVQSDSFEIVEMHSGNHLLYRPGTPVQIRKSVLPFVSNLADAGKVYRFVRVDGAGFRIFRSHETPFAPLYNFTFLRNVGLVSVRMSDGCTCYPYYGTNHALRDFTITSADTQPVNSLAENFRLDQNYPNPFNPTTTIKYQIPEVGRQRSEVSRVSLKVFDLLGREVATLVNEVKEPGEHQVQFDASALPSGVYLYQIKAREYSQVKKMILLR